ncbi:MAG TPA: multiheme c-type cytochrome [candidate division Zixibacteria bacterium]|nr:multiheme c-type cytochrome [candidate division Zixibacteria bacterium]
MKHKAFAIYSILFLFLLFTNSIHAQNQTVGPGSCGIGQENCHANDNNWWKSDDHYLTVSSIYDAQARYEQIAELAGVGAKNLFKGESMCMKCHGTVISGQEKRETDNGVSCESCHGAGSAYKDPHSEGDPKMGDQRPGYLKGFQLGMRELSNLDKRAELCVGCHYINDEKLLRAGHPSGNNFPYIKGIKQIAGHWDKPAGSADTDMGPFQKAMQKRGPIPTVAVAAIEQPRVIYQQAPRPPGPPPTIVSDPFFPLTAKGTLTLEPFPNVPDSATYRDILLIVKQRLELLYSKIGR